MQEWVQKRKSHPSRHGMSTAPNMLWGFWLRVKDQRMITQNQHIPADMKAVQDMLGVSKHVICNHVLIDRQTVSRPNDNDKHAAIRSF